MASIGDQPQGITYLLLVEPAESSLLLHAAIHFMRFSRAGRAAEMADRTVVAAGHVLDLAAGDQAESQTVRDLLDRLAEQVAAVEDGQADEFAAREEIAVGSEREEAATAAARGDVAMSISRPKASPLAWKVSSSSLPASTAVNLSFHTSPQKAVSGSTTAIWVGWSISKGRSRNGEPLAGPPSDD